MQELLAKLSSTVSWFVANSQSSDIQVIAGYNGTDTLTIGVVVELKLPENLLGFTMDAEKDNTNDQ